MDIDALKALSKRFPYLPPDQQAEAMQMLTHLIEGRELLACQENFLPFVRKMWPSFVGGRHHQQLAEAFEAIARGELKRVCISLPPRSTKSEFASYLFPAWFLGKYPDKQIMQASHKADLAVGFGRKLRNLVDTDVYREIFPELTLRSDSKAAGRWNTGQGGSYYAAGVGAGLAGFGADLCVTGSTILHTSEGPLTAREIVHGKRASHVLAFDHDAAIPVMGKIVGRGSRLAGKMVEIRAGGNLLRCSHDHPVWVADRGYVHAETVQKGDLVRVCETDLRGVWRGVSSQSVEDKGAPVLLEALLCQGPGQQDREDVRDLRCWVSGHPGTAKCEVLLHGVPSRLAVGENVGGEKSEVLSRDGGGALPSGVRYDLQSGESAGRGMFLLRGPEIPALSPHLAQEDGQQAAEPDRSLRIMSSWPSQCGSGTTVEAVDHVQTFRVDHGEEVFNITVEGHHNYFANGILTHNCIIDDPHDEQEAMHGAHDPEIFAKAFDWYQTGPRQRLQPGAAILVIHTRWSKVDLIGRLLQMEKEKEGADKWHVIEIPAITSAGTSYWPEYWPTEELLATKANIPPVRWNAQYMQNPTGEEGALVKREWWKRFPANRMPEMDFVIQSWDTAHRKTQRSDFSVCTTWGVFTDNDGRPNVGLMDVWRDRVEFPELKKKALELYRRYTPDACIIEGKAAGDALIQELRFMGVPVSSYTPSRGEDKIVRVNAVTDMFASGIVWAPSTQEADELIEEFADFPFGHHDDMVDATTLALLRFRQGNFLRLDSDEEEEEFEPMKVRKYY